LKILVVGATSALGAVLLPVLSEFADVTTAGRKDCDLHLDLADSADAIGWSDHFETVIELAAHFGGETDEAMLEAEDVNALGTLKLCQAAVRANASHFVLISSMFVCLPETSEYFGIYPLSKRHAEEVARLYCHERSLPLAIVRPSQIYGDSERFRIHQPFLYAMVDNAERSQDIAIYGTRDPRRNYIHADDVAAVIARVVKRRVEGTYACEPCGCDVLADCKRCISGIRGTERGPLLRGQARHPRQHIRSGRCPLSEDRLGPANQHRRRHEQVGALSSDGRSIDVMCESPESLSIA
jgi:UDP-glucose 4-epimerase